MPSTMDPIAHALSGASLAAARLRRATPLATSALVLGALVPDIDALVMFADSYASLAHRRGLTHGVLAIVVLPMLVTPLLLLWDRHVRRRRRPDAPPASARVLFAFGALGVTVHLFFDWINNYGIRLLMPFDSRWFYGDALFVIDPWLWLMLGGVTFLTWSARPVALVAWAAFWLLLSWPVLTSDLVGGVARISWLAGLLVLICARVWLSPKPRAAASIEKIALAAVIMACVYIGISIAANFPARGQVQAQLALQGIDVTGPVMIAPVPADPFAGFVVAEAGDRYYLAHWHWLREARLGEVHDVIPRRLDDPRALAAAQTRQVRDFMSWSRYPYAQIRSREDGFVVRFEDARYAGFDGGIRGPRVTLDANHQVISVR